MTPIQILRRASGSGLSVSLTPSIITRTAATSTITTTTPCVATPIGGLAPYTYLWAFQDGSSLFIVTPTSDSTLFRAAGMDSGDIETGLFICTVTDALGATAVSPTPVSVSITRS